MVKNRNRIVWIDVAKGIGLLSVFIAHLDFPYASAWTHTFAMPLFFFLSGLLYPGCKKYTFIQFAWRRFKSLVIPYFTLGAVIALFYCCVYAWHHEPVGTYVEMFRSFLVQEHYWTIWFLAALYLTQLIYYVIDWYFHRWKYAVSVASFFVCLFGLVRYRLGWGSLPWNLDVAFVAQFFFHLGHWFMHNKRAYGFIIKIRRKNKIFGIVVFCLVVNLLAAKACMMLTAQSLDMSIGMYGDEVLTFIAALAGIAMVIVVAPLVHSKFITYLGQNTMILFSWHSRIVIVACDLLYAYLGLFQQFDDRVAMTLRALVTLIIILLVLIPVNEVIKRLPCHKAFGV